MSAGHARKERRVEPEPEQGFGPPPVARFEMPVGAPEQVSPESDDPAVASRARPAFNYANLPIRRMQDPIEISSPDDLQEREAETVAEQIVSDAANPLGAQPGSASVAGVHRRPVANGSMGAGEHPPDNALDLPTGGQPLGASEHTFMEPRFAHDFSRVRIHADDRVANAASAVEARAFTFGQDIVFGAGEYAPASSSGRRLLAHELTHVV